MEKKKLNIWLGGFAFTPSKLYIFLWQRGKPILTSSDFTRVDDNFAIFHDNLLEEFGSLPP